MPHAGSQDMDSENIYGLIGNPVRHSLSPIIFRFLFEESRIPARYRIWEVNPVSLSEKILQLREETSGFNVTIPLKQHIIAFLDHIDDTARIIGAVNCVKNHNGYLSGYNTDFHGFVAMADPYRPMIDHQTGLVLGAGGAARAIVYSLLHHFRPETLYIASRRESSVLNLISDLSVLNGNALDGTTLHQPKEDVLRNDTKTQRINSESNNTGDRQKKLLFIPFGQIENIRPSFIVNCLPPDAFENWLNDQANYFYNSDLLPLFLDVNYFPIREKSVLKNLSGMSYVNGIRMLAVQAIESLNLWTGKKVDPDIVIRFLDREIKSV